MDGRELLKELMKRAGENPNSLANALNTRSLQSQIQRFLDGITKNPRWSTLEPVAKRYGVRVEAFMDPKAASVTAASLGLGGEKPERRPAALVRKTPRLGGTRLPLHELLLQLAAVLAEHDLSARKAAASLLADLALEPEMAETTAARIERLLEPMENGHRPAPE